MSNNRIIYNDSFSITVINSSGKIRRLYCPFLVKCVSYIDEIKEDSNVYVDEVYNDHDQNLLYKIAGKIYPYSKFRISMHF